MADTWQTILDQQSTLPINTNLAATSCFMPLPQYGVLQIEGADAHDFLQNLLTNDVSALAINQSQLSGFCNAKGRLFSLFLLIRHQEHYQIFLPENMCAILQQRLSMYILRSKVVITNVTDKIVCLGLKQAEEGLITENTNKNSPVLIQYLNTTQQFLYLCPQQQAAEICQNLLKQQWQLTSEKWWDLLDINVGIPLVLPESKEKFTPQQLNLDLINGVSFSKGCYPGQEIVARLHYLGTPSRRMFQATAESDTLPSPGETITDKEGKVIGHVVRSEYDKKSTIKLLLSLKLSEAHQNALINNTVIVSDIVALAND
ncbi:MAG: hypothetical protein COB23_05495 [Methylophaga sp.]|nr:MAG: hypothetical protein COB23_05495 [Methylophaga sp.]